MCVWHGNEPYPWALSVWPPVSDPSLDLQGQSWQSRHRPCTLMSRWGPVSSAYQKHSLHVSRVSPILFWGLLGWENAFHSYLFSVENEGRQGAAVTLATQFYSIPLFDQALGRLLPQLHHGGGVWADTHTHTHTHTQNQIKQAYSAEVTLQGHFHNADSTDWVWLCLPQYHYKTVSNKGPKDK